MKDILSVITVYREERGWTEYQLAERSGLPQSTISSWYRKNMVPTIPSLEKICTAFGITLSQLFAEEDAPVSLTEAQKKLLERWSRLSEEQQAVVFALIDKKSVRGAPFRVLLLADFLCHQSNGVFFVTAFRYNSGSPFKISSA